TEDDILESARDSQGIEKVEQIKFAIVERNGKISIIPNE
ncbi:YetF domain-containing protein, partial [Pseudomonas putida]